MRSTAIAFLLVLAGLLTLVAETSPQQDPARPLSSPQVERLKDQIALDVDSRRGFTQQMVDSIFSFSELGFQEYETQRYVTEILEDHGFSVERGVAGIPTAWMATWGSGTPVIALGTDVDSIPQASQKPGVAYRAPLLEGAPGHGEGHNSGQAVIVTAALAVKKIIENIVNILFILK